MSNSSAVSYEVSIGSRSFAQPDSDGMEMLVFEDHVDMVGMLTVRIGGGEEQPAWNFQIGDDVSLKLGSGQTDLFSGEVISVEPNYQVEGVSSITIRAMDKAHRLGRGRKTRFWEEMKDSDVASEVGQECGLSVDADPTEETLPYILQRNESNVTFLKRLAARNNFQLRVEDGKLLFKKASFSGGGVTVTMGDNLRSMRAAFNCSPDIPQKVVVRGWDIANKEEIVGEATSGDVTPIGDGELGCDLGSKFGNSTAYITDVPVANQGMANKVAQAEMERLARQFCRGSCTISGDDTVRAGTMVNFDGLSNGVNGGFYIISSRHVITARSGYTTELTFCSNTMGS
jgi:phage protein D